MMLKVSTKQLVGDATKDWCECDGTWLVFDGEVGDFKQDLLQKGVIGGFVGQWGVREVVEKGFGREEGTLGRGAYS